MTVESVEVPQDSDYYFDSYAHIGIHEDMLKDKVRTLSYRRAIFENPSLIRNKVVLDVGCGTGILSMFAAKAGARKVYAVERSSIVEYARQIIAENGFQDKIEIIQGIAEEIELPEKVDVVVSEWMGYALLYESMLPSVIFARNKFMKETGTMMPSYARMKIAAIEDVAYKQKKIGYWDDVYGFNYEPIKDWALMEPLVDTVPQDRIVTDDDMLVEFDLNKCQKEDLSVSANFTLWPFQRDTISAFVVWFDVFFKGGDKEIELSTSPYAQSTHWSQSIFYLKDDLAVDHEHCINGHFTMRPNERNPRDQDFTIAFTVNEKNYVQEYKMR